MSACKFRDRKTLCLQHANLWSTTFRSSKCASATHIFIDFTKSGATMSPLCLELGARVSDACLCLCGAHGAPCVCVSLSRTWARSHMHVRGTCCVRDATCASASCRFVLCCVVSSVSHVLEYAVCVRVCHRLKLRASTFACACGVLCACRRMYKGVSPVLG